MINIIELEGEREISMTCPTLYLSVEELSLLGSGFKINRFAKLVQVIEGKEVNMLVTRICNNEEKPNSPRKKPPKDNLEKCSVYAYATNVDIKHWDLNSDWMLRSLYMHQLPRCTTIFLYSNEFNSLNHTTLVSVIRNLILGQPIQYNSKIYLNLPSHHIVECKALFLQEESYNAEELSEWAVVSNKTKFFLHNESLPIPEDMTHVNTEEISRLLKSYGLIGEKIYSIFSYMCQKSLLHDISAHEKLLKSAVPLNSLLLTGRSGTGKTFIISELAKQFPFRIVHISYYDLISRCPGYPENALRFFWEETCEESGLSIPTVLCLDDLHILFPAQDENTTQNEVSEQKLMHMFLRLMNHHMNIHSGFFVLGITNSYDNLDMSVSDCFQYRVNIPLPQTDLDKQRILEYHCHSNCADHDLLSIVSGLCHGYSGADLERLCSLALNECRKKGNQALSMAHFQPTLQTRKPMSSSMTYCVSTGKSNERSDYIGGLESVKQSLTECIVWPFLYSNIYKTMNLRPISGMLLYGAPGTGKTTLARSITQQAKLAFLSINATDLVKSAVGDSEKAIARLFDSAINLAPSVVFVDEIDSLFGSRESGGSLGRKMVAQLITELDRISNSHHRSDKKANTSMERRVICLAATNHPQLLDTSLLQPGRLEKLIHVPVPTPQEREDILLNLKRESGAWGSDVDINVIVGKTDLFTGSDLKHLCKRAGLSAAMRDLGNVNAFVLQKDFDDACSVIVPSVDQIHEQQLLDWRNFSRIR